MLTSCPQDPYSVFGPSSSPLYFTTLSRLPNRLVVAGLQNASLCRITLTSADLHTPVQQCLQASPVNGVCTWPLFAMPAHTELLCTWRVEEPMGADTVAIDTGATARPPCEGRFRILNVDSRERLCIGQKRLTQVSDENITASANALFMAEFGLYHEALLIIETYLKSQRRRKNLLLARTVQTLIYKQMLRQIEQEQQDPSAHPVPLDWYKTWTINRERYYRELSIALMKGQCPRRCLKEVSSVS